MNIDDNKRTNQTSDAAYKVVAHSQATDEFGAWIEQELVALELQFADFVTKNSTRAYFNHQR